MPLYYHFLVSSFVPPPPQILTFILQHDNNIITEEYLENISVPCMLKFVPIL